MRRTSTMTMGFVLIFLGAQLALVDSYLLTPRVSNFIAQQEMLENLPPGNISNNAQSPFNQVAFRTPNGEIARPMLVTQKRISPPKWLCWPVLFCGTVVLLHGVSMKRH